MRCWPVLFIVFFLVLVPAFAAEVPDAGETEPVPSDEPYSVSALDDDAGSGIQEDAALPAALVSLFGEYRPRTQTVTEYRSDGSSVTYQQVIPGAAGLDFVWLASVALFALVLFCIFKLIGGLLKL